MAGRGVIRTGNGGGRERLSAGDHGFQEIFLHSAISIWLEDISRLRDAIRELARRGVSYMRKHLDAHPDFIMAAADMITVVDVNAATLRLFGVETREPLLGPLSRTRPVADPLMQARLGELIVLLATDGRFHRGESLAVTPDGRQLHILVETEIPAEADPYPYMLVSFIDLTEQRRAEQALRDSERRLADIIDFLPDPAFAIDDAGRVIAWNKAMEELTAIPATGMMGRGGYEYALPFYGERRQLLIDLVLTPDPAMERRYSPIIRREKDLLIAEMPFPSLRGALTWLWGKAVALHDSAGRPVGAIEILRDITERKRIEEELRLKEERLRALVENLGAGVVVLGESLRFTLANPAADRILGLPTGGLVGRHISEFLTVEGLAHMREQVARRRRGERGSYVQECIRADGMKRLLQITATPQHDGRGEYAGSLGVLYDITDQKALENSLEQERLLLQTLIDNLPDCIFVKDPQSRFILVNRATVELFGAGDPREILGKRDRDFLPAEYADGYTADDARVFRSGRVMANIEEKMPSAAGEMRWVLTTKAPIFDAQGRVTSLVGISRDITERKRSEEALRQSEERYHLLLDTLNEGIWAMDREERIMFVNPRMAQMLGYTEEEMLGMPVSSFTDAPTLQTLRQGLALPRSGSIERDDIELVRKDGTRRVATGKISLLRGTDGAYTGAIASMTDITEQRTAERTVRKLSEQLAEAQKMEAIGRLAGGVAHDFNNLLTTILGNVELLKGVGSLPRDALELAEEVEMAGMRAATLTSQLLAFGRKQMLQPRILDVNSLIGTLARLLGRLIREDITLDLRLGSDVSAVRADPNRMEQVIINLTVNARDAMPAGGRITLETANAALDGSGIGGELGAVPGPYVVITVSDTGMGMDEGVRAHLFEPFFTTKEMGKGTGLGLSTAYGIVRQSGGYIRVVTEPMKGSAFSIYLPAEAGRAGAEAPPRAAASSPAGTETILLVEDEEHVLKMVSRLLRGFGYSVLGRHRPAEALEMDAAEAGRVDLLITDIVLPGMNGLELAERMKGRMPGLRVLFVSGYADEAAFRSRIAATGAAFLPKPFSRDALARKVREVLDTG